MSNDPCRHNLAWKLNWYRQSELEGALLLGRMAGRIDDSYLAGRLTRHCAEEAEHSRIWAETIEKLNLPHIRILRSYQSFYVGHGGQPSTLLEVMCFTQIFERRVHARFHEELRKPETPGAAQIAFRRMIEDEKDHLAWVAAWISEQPHAEDCLRRYREIDRLVFNELRHFDECLPEIPGLGRRPAGADSEHSLHHTITV